MKWISNKDGEVVPVILCGGQGSRLEELTRTINKPLITVGNAPIIFHVAFRFWVAGAKKIYLAAGCLDGYYNRAILARLLAGSYLVPVGAGFCCCVLNQNKPVR